MKALLCPNCGSGEFNELAGKCQCAYCGAEFEVNMTARRYRTAPHYYIRRETTGVKPHPIPYFRCTTENNVTIPGLGPCRIRHSYPGMTIEEWRRRTMGCQMENLKVAIGNVFLPLFRIFLPSLREAP